ncbi:MAG: alanine--glyoxylate aminotransferase family protein [Oligoflexales bacterium]
MAAYPEGVIQNRYFYPGPVDIDLTTHLSALTGPSHHRSPDFITLFQETRLLLQEVFGSEQAPLILTSSGTGAMESLMRSVTSSNDSIVVIDAGKFGQRWAIIGEKLKRATHLIKVPWGEVPEECFLEGRIPSKTRAVFFQATETSTGLRLPLEHMIASIKLQAPDALICVDAVSAAIAEPLHMACWGVDGMISGSQKGFGAPAGLSFLALSPRAWSVAEKQKSDSFYFDMVQERKAQEQGSGNWTTATTLVCQLHTALSAMKNIGFQNIHQHHEEMMEITRSVLCELDLQLTISSQSHAARSVTSFQIPKNSQLQKRCQYWGVHLASGQGTLKGSILRLAHLGLTDPWKILTALQVIELSLYQENLISTLGKANKVGMQTILKHNAARFEDQ